MSFLSISRPNYQGMARADGDSPQEATFLSPESLTFPGITGFAGMVLVIIARLADKQVSDWVAVLVGAVLGGMLVALGLLDPKRVQKDQYGVALQVITGAFNTVLLIAALLGIATVAGSANGS